MLRIFGHKCRKTKTYLAGGPMLLDRFAYCHTTDRDLALENVTGRTREFRSIKLPPKGRWQYKHNQARLNSLLIMSYFVTKAQYKSDDMNGITLSAVVSGRELRSVRGDIRVMPQVAAFWSNAPTQGEIEQCQFFTVSLERTRLQHALEKLERRVDVDAFLAGNWGKPLPGAAALDAALRSMLHSLDSFGSLSAGQAQLFEDLVYGLTTQVIAENTSGLPVRSADQKAFLRCVDYIETRLDQPLSVFDIAAVAGVSLRSTQLLFQRHADCNMTQFILRRRLHRARAMLLAARAEDTVLSVALAVGFSNISYFTRSYRAAFGETPTVTRGR